MPNPGPVGRPLRSDQNRYREPLIIAPRQLRSYSLHAHMTISSIVASLASLPETIETRRSWIICLTALGIAAVSFAAPAITVVGLKSIAADLGSERSVPALAYSLAWLGSSFGGIPMGRAAEHVGIRLTVIFGSLMIATGLLLAQSGDTLSLLIGYGV